MRLKRPDGLNVIPFIDIMLVLFAIVLTISTFITQSKIKIDLPSANSSEKISEKKDNFEILIDKNSKFYIKEKEITLEQLKIEISTLKNRDEVIIVGDKQSEFGKFIEVVDMLKNRGHENLQIITKHEK